ncbi:MAG: ABC transporter permease, partial [Candidatus Competibacterales bacterium]|nr:ABC transporter permease [Candidatus Competibacterales bacterium]
MNDFGAAFNAAFTLITALDPDLVEIVVLSLQVSLSAVAVAALLGLPLGAAMALFRFPGRGAVIALLNALMGLPPVVVGLMVYLMLSRAGPLGEWGLLFTPTAMVIAQC